MSDSNNHDFDDHAKLCAHEERLKYMSKEIGELKAHINVVENKCDCIYDITSSLKALTAQMMNMDNNVAEMKVQFKEDIQELGENQKTISDKVDRLEIHSNSYVADKTDREFMGKRIKEKVIEYIVMILVAVLLLGIFPHLKDFIL